MRDEDDRKERSTIGEDLVVDGNITCKSDLLIEGNVEGNVSCVALHVGKSGNVTGDIKSEETRIEGRVTGMVRSKSVELKDGCTLEGDIESQTLAVDHGARFTGSVKPTGDARVLRLNEAAE